jgi:hypothetical protein
MLVVLEKSSPGGCGTVVGAFAHDPSAATIGSLPEIADDDQRSPLVATVLFSNRTLDDLGLVEGPQTWTPPSSSCTLPAFDSAVQNAWQGTPGTSWTPLEPATAAADLGACLCIMRHSSCPTYGFQVVPLTFGGSYYGAFAVPAGSNAALIGFVGYGLDTNHLLHVTQTGSVAERILDEPVGFGRVFGAMPGVGDEVYFSSDGGGIWRARPNGAHYTMELVTRTPSGGSVHWIAGDLNPDGSLADLYALTLEGPFEHFDGQTWVKLDDSRDGMIDSGALAGGLIMLGPDEAVAAKGRWGSSVVHAKGATSHRETVDESVHSLCALAQIPGFGTVAGGGNGAFFNAPSSGWAPLPTSGYGLHVLALAPVDFGFVYAGQIGFVGTYLASSGEFCAPQEIAPDDVTVVLPIGDHVFLAGLRPTANPNLALTLLHRQ